METEIPPLCRIRSTIIPPRGQYVVTLTVTDTIFGCSDTHTDTVRVSIPTAVVDGGFGHFGCGPLTVDFEESSTPGAVGTIVSWDWDFGDGNTSDEIEPTHVYEDPGVYTVTLTVTNSYGCTSTDVNPFFVQVIGPDVNFGADTTFAPCPDLTVNFTDSTIFGAPIISWAWNFGDGGTSFLQNPTHTYTDYGSYDVSLTIIDIDGCSRTLVFEDHIVVQDTIDPVFDTCPPDQVELLSASCDFELPDYTVLAAASDNCTDPLVITQSPAPGTIISADQLITLETMDESDSTATCSFMVYLMDNIDPVITVCPPDQNVSFDAACAYTLLDYTGLVEATDNCLDPVITQFPMAGTVITGTETITITATDTAGNTATCTFDVIPVDDTPPTIDCPEDLTVNNDPGICGAVVTYATPVGVDNCAATTSLVAGIESGELFPVGTTMTTYQVVDDVALTATCSFEVTVIDNENPTIDCPADITVNTDPSNCFGTVTFDDPVVADNCDVESLTQTGGLGSGSEFPIGTTTNTFEVIDLAGNATSCSFDVVVIDNEAPTISCPDDISSCFTAVTFNEPEITDNCPDLELTLDAGLASGSDFPVGTTTNTYSVTDAAGNSTSCSFEITVFPVPEVDAGPDQNISAGKEVMLEANSPDAIEYNWSPPDGLDDPGSEDPIAGPEQTTVYTLTITTADGCQNSDEVTVNVKLEIEINNYMSPNGDGKNDTWIIKGHYLLDACTIQIYDSWGNQVYESTGYDNGWDGTKEGVLLPQGNYYYVVDCGDDQPFTGSITLIR